MSRDEQLQQQPGDDSAQLPFALQAYGLLARSRYVSESPSHPDVVCSFAEAVESLLQYNIGVGQGTRDASTEAAAASVGGKLVLPPVVARAILDLVHEWLNETQAVQNVEVPSATCHPFPDGFWVAVVEHFNWFWLPDSDETGPQVERHAQRLMTQSALVVLRRLVAAGSQVAIGEEGINAAKAALRSHE